MPLMSYYDPQSDQILNCKPGSYAYAHEERHRAQYKAGIADKIDRMGVWCYYVAAFAGFIGLVFSGWIGMLIGIGLGQFPYICGLVLLEVDAYVVGYINHRRDLKS